MPRPVVLPFGVSQEALLTELRRLSWVAADILRAYARGEVPPHGFPTALSIENGGEGPVSAADLAVNKWLMEGISNAFPDASWTVMSEETAKEQLTIGNALPGEWLWILDPLDGTKDFLQGTGEYAVHIALIKHQRPVVGVVLIPEVDELWIGLVGQDAWCEDRTGKRSNVRFSNRSEFSELILVASRNHRDEKLESLIDSMELGGSVSVGSVGCKVASILRGESDIYISLSGKTAPKDWDMAAPEAGLIAAGGRFTHADFNELSYNTGDVRQAGCLIASHGKVHNALVKRAKNAMSKIDRDFIV